MSWNFKLCGQDEVRRVKVREPTLNDTYAATFRARFSIPEDEKLHFHLDVEDCKKLRPFKDLYERLTLEKVDGRVIFLHSKAPLRVASRPKVERDNGSEELFVDKADSNNLQVLFEDNELSQAETEAEEKNEEQYDTSGDRVQSPLETQAEDNGDELDAVSDDNEQPGVRSQADKDSDEQHDLPDNTQQSQIETQAEANSDEQHSVSDDNEQSQVEAEADENSDAGNEAQGDLAATTAQPQDVAGLKYIALIHGGMHPNGSSTSSVDKTDHQCKIRFRIEQPGGSRRDWANVNFRPQEFMTSESTLLRDLPGMIKARLVRVLRNEAGKKNDLAKKYRRIFFRLSVVVQAYGLFAIDLHDPKYGLRFRTIQDCLVIPGMEESQLEVVVRAESTNVERPTDRSERRASREALETIGENEMIQAIPLDEEVNSSIFRRVGNYETVDSSSEGHPYARPLIAEIENDRVELRKGDASVFGDELVGDVRNGDNAPTGMKALKDYILAPQYIVKAPKILNKTNLFALIREAGPPTDDLEKLPILPPLSFNLFLEDTFDTTAEKIPHSNGSGETQRSSDAMTAVVRFVNHLTSDKGRVLAFHNDTEIAIDEPDTYATAEKAVITSIEERREEYNGWDAFKPDSTIPCYLELFVRPQLPAPQKLFRIPTTGEGSEAKMMGFLSPQEVNKGMRAVYMEAHVWPKE
ncbi:hypothetical protein KC340_g15163 [Hortaea werneckii]|nr:hypothetical protein KC342_g14645 [Hortaea werneckii]KAI7064357.1 hypothetical protein KC339_g16084 [Hortaea werneckii]KAI7217350.1 hypothetical protein KC365_g12966 [Hortaea werneckii]KAI7297024.1 hypothetical protein KC340_g15163 [Hortaea werneckii]KAI7377838.1 hypothetical protein KC328_g14218 [Hortaea werneckii]